MRGSDPEHDEGKNAGAGAESRIRSDHVLLHLPPAHSGLVGLMQHHGGIRHELNPCCRDSGAEGDLATRGVFDADLVLDRARQTDFNSSAGSAQGNRNVI